MSNKIGSTTREDFGTKRSDWWGLSVIAYPIFLILSYFLMAIFGVKKASTQLTLIIFFSLVAVYEIFMIPWLIKSKREELKKKQSDQLNAYKNAESVEKQISECFGDNKLSMQLAQRRIIERKAEKAMDALTNAISSSAYQEKEANWAVTGGIASGLAGPVAGAAAAVDTMLKNAEIRQENERNQQAANKIANDATSEFSKAIKNSTQWLADIKKLYNKQKKTITWSLDALFSQLCITTVAVDVDSLTGAVKIQAAWSNKNKDSWIDGSIRGILYTKKGKLAGCVYLNLPIGGTMSEGCEVVDIRLTGHCSEPLIKEKEYTIQYEPINLWRLVVASKSMQFGDGTTEEEHNRQVKEYEDRYLEKLNESA